MREVRDTAPVTAMTETSLNASLLDIDGLSVSFAQRRQPPVHALVDVSLTVGQGEIVGLVGESGSGKTTLGRAPLGLVPISKGRVSFEGRDITNVSARERRSLTAEMQMVFQDPYGSLNPYRTVGDTLVESLLVHARRTSTSDKRRRVAEVLDLVALPSTAAERFPREFSGGQRQRIAIARALVVKPKLVICDEPVSALDLSVQAQVINLLSDLRRELGLAMIFISHDLTVVEHIADRTMVLYQGAVMEEAPTAQLMENPSSPYTAALRAAAPVPDPERQRIRRDELVAIRREWEEYRDRHHLNRPHQDAGVQDDGDGARASDHIDEARPDSADSQEGKAH